MTNLFTVSAMALVALSACHTAFAQNPAQCSDVGANQHPRLKPGIYQVARDVISGVPHLYYIDPKTGVQTQLGDASWDLTAGITALGDWLYIISEGKLHRANPETGEWFPKPFDGSGRCAWYVGWPGPIWAHHNSLYAIKPNAENSEESRIERLNFEAATDKIVRRFFRDRIEVH